MTTQFRTNFLLSLAAVLLATSLIILLPSFKKNSPVVEVETNPTSNWKKYTNTQYGFLLSYSPEIILRENCTVYAMGTHLTCLESPDFSVLINEPMQPNQPGSKTSVVSNGFGIYVDLFISDYLKDISALKTDLTNGGSNVSEVLVNNNLVLKTSTKNNPEAIKWYVLHNNNVYSIFSPYNSSKYPVIEQIVSTFKFQ